VKKFSKGHHSSLNELNITPLLDLAFVLLVIFIITTPQLSNDLEMNLPTAKKKNTPPANPPPKLNRILVDAEGRITLNGQTFQLPALKQTLLTMKQSDPDTSVVVRGSAEVDYQKVVGVLDVLQQANITKVGLATEVTP
jgi:biopolymer transport protein ExbD